VRVKFGIPVVAALFTLVCALPGCDDHVIGQSAPFVVTCLRDPPLTYDNFGHGMLNRHCNSCHTEAAREGQRGGAPLGVDFDDWDMVLAWAERIQVRTVDESTMPPSGGTLLADERAKFAEWMRCQVLPSVGKDEQAPSEEEEGT
jgi:cytochrome c5